ncbi:PEP/pyruvate-binding domain-containing protein [Uliginosibacterium sp. TH139]|uniref:PEP/pyruvate-binding domain-containing protein n=1 Tax=Uliginosibacterium sp. TH139 TaxID=2067453 RepID=UPI000C79B09E|nr:PEP/pyruvate-binding domain-containing protein [Uliginosibacterium sp. TH139]PLK50658.1 pyruvate, phosphate dikinase [Uliginosibacterium sp. TH139]
MSCTASVSSLACRLRRIVLAALCLLSLGTLPAQAQLAAKPSAFRAAGEVDPLPPASEAYRHHISQRADFDRLARRYNLGTPLELPHLLFLIDRQHGDQPYFINTRRYGLHEQFLTRGPLHLQLGRAAMAANYRAPDRRFILGTLSWQNSTQQWTFECWEGDQLDTNLLRTVQQSLQAAFFAPLLFKANAQAHERVATAAGVAFVSQEQLIREQAFLPLNEGVARGRVRVVPAGGIVADADPQDILVLDEVPISLPPVAGVITSRPSTAISHVNLLAKGWGIPNAWLRNALSELSGYDRQWVELRVTRTGYTIQPIPPQTLVVAHKARTLPRPDLSHQSLTPLSQLHARDRAHCGAKAANLGEIRAAKIPSVQVPDGFCIPFARYAAFIKRADAQALIQAALATPHFDDDARVRHAALETLRSQLIALPLPAAWLAEWQAQWQQQLGGTGVFVRSSSNSEDLPGFSGAGLYTTVPNVRLAEALPEAVKTVWASVFNSEAFEARRAGAIPLEAVAMGVLVQTAIDARRSGVMITRDPFDPAHRGASYIAAKRGIGIKVVEGRRIAEQVMVDARSGAVQLLSHADEQSELTLDESGGVRERAIDEAHQQQTVLDEASARRLARVGSAIRQLFRGRDQDIEWATTEGEQIVVLQARPYAAAVPTRLATQPPRRPARS